jgi:AraC-like DNA-binding protein
MPEYLFETLWIAAKNTGGRAMSKTYLASMINILSELLREYGYDPEPFYLRMGIDLAATRTPGARIPYETYAQLWTEAAKLIGDPCFVIKAAEHYHPSHMHALGYAWMASRTLREALERMQRYTRVISDVAMVTCTDEGNDFSVELKSKFASAHLEITMIAGLAVILSLCRANYGQQLNPTLVHLTYKAPDCSEQYYGFFKSKVSFEEQRNRIAFFREDIDKPLSSSNALLAEVNDQVIVKYLAQLNKDDIMGRAKTLIVDMLPSGKVTLEKIARRLNMSTRTLQREFAKYDKTFLKVLAQARLDLAKGYLRDPNTSLEEISFMLGFSEYSTFSRFIKKHTQYSPISYREKLLLASSGIDSQF